MSEGIIWADTAKRVELTDDEKKEYFKSCDRFDAGKCSKLILEQCFKPILDKTSNTGISYCSLSNGHKGRCIATGIFNQIYVVEDFVKS